MKAKSKKVVIKVVWTCSDYCSHKHRFKFVAWTCGRAQLLLRKICCALFKKEEKGGPK